MCVYYFSDFCLKCNEFWFKIENYVYILCEDLGRGELWEFDLRKKKRIDYFLVIYIEFEVWNMFYGLIVRMV